MFVQEQSNRLDNPQFSSDFDFKTEIVRNWDGGYQFKLNLEAIEALQDWEVEFFLPHSIEEVRGANLVDLGDNRYRLSGQDETAELQPGDSISHTFKIQNNGQLDLIPNFIASRATSLATEVDDSRIIDVELDFEGNLAKAIAAAKNGDVVELGNKTYYTDGLIVDKDITIRGQEDSIVDGGGTSQSIFYLNAGASGATIENIEITNGDNGIFVESATNLTLQNLDINNIGIDETIRNGPHNIGIYLNHAEGVRLLDSTIHNIGRKAVGIIDTDGATIDNITVYDVNLAAEHAQSHDAAGIKFFNTNDVILRNSYFADINANFIWNDTTNATLIENNILENVGEDFLAPKFNNNVYLSGISNEKSSNAIVRENRGTAEEYFSVFQATEFSTETMIFEDNDFSSYELGTTDYWVNESVEKLIATTEDPDAANFSLFADEYAAQANIGG